jgi:protein MpaA
MLLQPVCSEAGYRVYVVRTRRLREQVQIYLSAGIHGDESGGTEGLVTWAERNIETLRCISCLVFPCLNPWGLVNNSRFDEAGRDLNRRFDRSRGAVPTAVRSIIRGHRFEVALMLHEDFDGEGIYIYEVQDVKPFWGEVLLGATSRSRLPIDPRAKIDSRRARNGVVRRPMTEKLIALAPEAIYLHQHHSRRTFTFETPSEFSLIDRVESQVALVNACVGMMQEASSQNLAQFT